MLGEGGVGVGGWWGEWRGGGRRKEMWEVRMKTMRVKSVREKGRGGRERWLGERVGREGEK